MSFQRILQTLSLSLFVLLLWQAAFPLASILPVDMFLQLDPIVFVGAGLSGRTLVSSLLTFLVVLFSTVLLGRFFCGMICPMGTTVDLAQWFILKGEVNPGPEKMAARLRQLKYLALLFILGGALWGVSLVYLGSPLAWITRLYGLILYPVLCSLSDSAIGVVRPIANNWNLTGLAYAQISSPRFDLLWPIAVFFIGILSCLHYSPRFWCRYVCPSGAILALLSSRPVLRRHVSEDCTRCGLCRKKCPMGAVGDDPRLTDYRECIVCETCVHVCPSKAVSFKAAMPVRSHCLPPLCLDRRKAVLAGFSGAGVALITLSGLRHIEGPSGRTRITHLELIRPPGALPEKDFLSRCIGCGECMKACPTNGLQPAGLAAGLSGFFSPVLTPYVGACEPHCTVCGHVCPTNAIRPLSLEERVWAKVGTAHVLRHKCLAWEHGKKCLICAEFCVYGALEFKIVPGIPAAVPFVDESRCSGCGVCEHNCPVQARSAIIVEPMGALRLPSGSYREKGREAGLLLSVRRKGADELGLPGGKEIEEPLDPKALPPGFTE